MITVKTTQATLTENNSIHRTLSQEIGKALGVFTVGLLVVGFSYVLLNRGYILIRKYVSKESNPLLIETAQMIYSDYRKPIFYVHVFINISAILFGTLHGLLVLVRNPLQADLGWLALLVMIASSISGFVMWQKIWPIWNNKDMRSIIGASHRQWLLTFLLVFILFLHVALRPE